MCSTLTRNHRLIGQVYTMQSGHQHSVGPQVALAYQAKERELLVKEAAIYRIFVYDGQARE